MSRETPAQHTTHIRDSVMNSGCSMDPNLDVGIGAKLFTGDKDDNDDEDSRYDETGHLADTNEQEGKQQGGKKTVTSTRMIRTGVRGD